MRKCPNCAEVNINESLFCKHCGHCLMAPDPEEARRSAAAQTEHPKLHEGIDFHDSPIAKKSRVYGLKRRPQTAPSVIGGWVLILNMLAFFLMSEIVYLVTR
jgi:uncharacterized membrane protein YvbJ